MSTDLLEWAETAVREVGKTLGPDDDWEAVAFVPGEDGTLHLCALVMPDSDEMKEQLVDALSSYVRSVKAHECLLVLSTWACKVSTEEFAAGGYIRPSEAPDREELLVLDYYSATSSVAKMAEIRRGGEHPELGDFEVIGEGVSRFDRIQAALT